MRLRKCLLLCLFAGFLRVAMGQDTYIYRILVAYSAEVEGSAQHPNPISDIDHVINWISNTLYANSTVGDIGVELACLWRSGYNESNSVFTDRSRLSGSGDGYLDDVHSLRDRYRADICCLWRLGADGSGYTGVAAGIDPGPTNAFCVFVGWPEVPEGNLPHEIGHLYGALHQNSSASTPYAFGHAFEYTDGLGVTKGTIMRSGIPWIDYLSSPNITYDGRVIGTASWRDVARLTRGRLDGTLNYYSYTPSSIQDYRQTQATVSLTSETVQAKEVRLAIATSSITIGSGYTVQNGARFTARVNGSAIGKRNAPAPANQDPTEAVAVPADLTLRISTAGGAMQLHYAVPARSKVQVHIFNAAGRHMLSEFLGTLDAGTYVRSLPMELLAAGSYYLSIEAGELRSNATFVKR